LLLIDSCKESIGDPEQKERFNSNLAKAQSISRKYELFKQRLAVIKPAIDPRLTENLDSMLTGIFDLIRSSRNDAGHPARGNDVDRDSIYSHLRLFIPYTQRIFGLIAWYSVNKT
jgi:hypothetical protein